MTSRILSTDIREGLFLVEVQEQRFTLSKEELLSEPGNGLIDRLLKPDARRDWETGFPIVFLDTDPNLFRLTHAHLKGLEIFPLLAQGVSLWANTETSPIYLGSDATLKNLLRDAEDFGFKTLCGKIRGEMAGQPTVISTQPRSQVESKTPAMAREPEYRLAMNLGRWTHWNERTAQGTAISQTTKEGILLKLINSDIELVETYMPIPHGYQTLAAWDEYPSSECLALSNILDLVDGWNEWCLKPVPVIATAPLFLLMFYWLCYLNPIPT